MTTHTHNCKATGCQKLVPLNIAMCMQHWRLVPSDVQRRVYKCWNELQRWPLDTAAMAVHQAAITDAIAAVEKKQTRKIAEKTVREGALFDV